MIIETIKLKPLRAFSFSFVDLVPSSESPPSLPHSSQNHGHWLLQTFQSLFWPVSPFRLISISLYAVHSFLFSTTRTTNLFQLKITKSPNHQIFVLINVSYCANHQITKDREEKRQNQWCLQIAGSTWLPVDPRSNKMPQLHHLSVISPETSRVDFGYHWKQAELTLDITGNELTLDIMLLHHALRVLTHVCDDGVN